MDNDSAVNRAKELERRLRSLCNDFNVDFCGVMFDNVKDTVFAATVFANIENSPLRSEHEHAELRVFMMGRLTQTVASLASTLNDQMRGSFHTTRPEAPAASGPKIIS